MPRPPRIIVLMGDPSGIGPEITARLLADPTLTDRAEAVLLGDKNILAAGKARAGLEFDLSEAESIPVADFSAARPVLVHRPAANSDIPLGEVSQAGGRCSLDDLTVALDLVQKGQADGICFAPLNKEALHLAGMEDNDEMQWLARQLNHTGPRGHISVLNGLWAGRVTSHMAMRQVPDMLTKDNVLTTIELIDSAIRRSGVTASRIAVAAFNPHGGEGGIFGMEEEKGIAPAVAEARARGIHADGPFPADTLFNRVRDEGYDGVVSMYHDQAQIAMKLIGFDESVCVQGGLEIPITTPAHGTAFDIVAKGVARVGSLRASFDLAAAMARRD